MELSIYHAVISRKDRVAKELFEDLETIYPGLFTDLLRIEGGEPYAKLALMYIIFAYSKESPVLVLGERFSKQKIKIADYVQLPDRLLGPVVNLQSRIVREVVTSYLNAQQDRRWQHYIKDKELYDDMFDESLKFTRKDDGKPDFKLILDAAKHRRELLTQIEEQEKAFKSEGEYAFVMENMEEIKKIGKESNGSQSMKLESSPHVK